MGHFDTVRGFNISHKVFDRSHNGEVFQTQDMACDQSEFCIFNDTLYRELDGSSEQRKRGPAIAEDYSGTISIYAPVISHDIERWVEYDLSFESGRLVDVTAHEERILKDRRDFSEKRPAAPSNRVEVRINVSGCETPMQEAIAARLDEQALDAIRDIVGDPKATIFFPKKPKENLGLSLFSGPKLRTVASVVQTREDFEKAANGMVRTVAPNGDEISIFLDEL